MEAAELWMTPVTSAPARTPRSGFSKAVSTLTNEGESLRGAMDALIMVIPCIRIPKPTSIMPMSLRLCFFEPMIMITPIRATTREKHLGSSSLRKTLPSLLIPDSDRIHAVSVVPISDPKITLTVDASSIMPELTKPTSITVIADDDWIAIVIRIPMRSPL